MYNKSVEQCVMGYAVRYERMGKIIKELFTNNKYSSATQINLFIPLTEIFHSMHDVQRGKSATSVSAAILNLCSHYKNFFKRGYGVECNIYIIHSLEEYNFNKNYIPEYGHKNGKISDKDIFDACELLKTICPYLNNVQFLETKHECALMIMDIENYTMASSKNIPNIILSKDLYNSQLVCIPAAQHGNGIYEYIMIRPLKHQGEDQSYYITKTNIYESFCKVRKVAFTDNMKMLPTDSNTYALLLSMTRLPERNIKSLYGMPTAIKMLLETEDRSTWNDAFIIGCRHNAISVVNQFAMYAYNEMVKYSGYPDLYDPDSINEISNSYYKYTPVDFMSLM